MNFKVKINKVYPEERKVRAIVSVTFDNAYCVHGIKRREVKNFVPVMIAIAALINISHEALPAMLLAAVAVGLPQFIVMMLRPETYGGADLKVSTAAAFFLGLRGGIIALTTGLFLSVICTLIYRAVKKASFKEAFPLVPYLSVGCAVGYAAVILLA